ncbi:hypothetical protein B0T17DRAFT_34798 [Bombardia bombarda]|uniref:Uncharacterized protein n=1 Tax=Bombardia bombarda TaxID=252184 RepID=A0AA39XJK2_9PEZI|nr:hypothetical protein B0T17DRAFT_34798 [Bombardia bombarda]
MGGGMLGKLLVAGWSRGCESRCAAFSWVLFVRLNRCRPERFMNPTVPFFILSSSSCCSCLVFFLFTIASYGDWGVRLYPSFYYCYSSLLSSEALDVAFFFVCSTIASSVFQFFINTRSSRLGGLPLSYLFNSKYYCLLVDSCFWSWRQYDSFIRFSNTTFYSLPSPTTGLVFWTLAVSILTSMLLYSTRSLGI